MWSVPLACLKSPGRFKKLNKYYQIGIDKHYQYGKVPATYHPPRSHAESSRQAQSGRRVGLRLCSEGKAHEGPGGEHKSAQEFLK